jgi:hypothetical protein
MTQTERRLLVLEARQKFAREVLDGRHDFLLNEHTASVDEMCRSNYQQGRADMARELGYGQEDFGP